MSHRKKKAPKVPQRLDWADMAKGIGILLMAVGHSAIPPDCWGIWIYSFHMPLFFFLSGYFFSLRPGGVADTIRHKAFPILMPYLSYSLGMWLWNTLRALSSGAAVDLQPLLGIPLQWPGTPWSGTAWFFMGLFVAECVFALAVRLTRERPLPLLAVTFGLAALAWIYACLGGLRLPWRADAAALLLPYLALGLLFRRHQEELARPFRRSGPYWALTLGLLAANLLLTSANARFGSTHIDYNLRLLNEPFTAYGAGICGLAFCLLLCRKLPPHPSPPHHRPGERRLLRRGLAGLQRGPLRRAGGVPRLRHAPAAGPPAGPVAGTAPLPLSPGAPLPRPAGQTRPHTRPRPLIPLYLPEGAPP